MSESNYVTADDILHKRYYRALEVLFHCSREALLPWRIIANSLFADPTRLNRGNSVRCMREYLLQFQDAGLGKFSEDRKYFSVTEEGKKLILKESKDIAKYLKPLVNRAIASENSNRSARAKAAGESGIEKSP